MIKIVTHYDPKPIPMRQFDWTAVTDNYDGAPDSSNRHQVGYGRTEQEAIDDLKSHLEDDDDEIVSAPPCFYDLRVDFLNDRCVDCGALPGECFWHDNKERKEAMTKIVSAPVIADTDIQVVPSIAAAALVNLTMIAVVVVFATWIFR
jgi:hypothetical protein